jgi:hypothetical protein
MCLLNSHNLSLSNRTNIKLISTDFEVHIRFEIFTAVKTHIVVLYVTSSCVLLGRWHRIQAT